VSKRQNPYLDGARAARDGASDELPALVARLRELVGNVEAGGRELAALRADVAKLQADVTALKATETMVRELAARLRSKPLLRSMLGIDP
jgi:NAD(P)-dependent dehydrogenase (short-subunit alcohol dehydrogenase family)